MKIQNNLKEIIDNNFHGDALAYLKFWSERNWAYEAQGGSFLQWRKAVLEKLQKS